MKKDSKKYYLFTIDENTINIMPIIFIVLLVGITYLIFGKSCLGWFGKDLYLACALAFPYFILHELLHAFSYVIHGGDYKKITFGLHLEKGVLCCLCKQNITKKNILISLLYPFMFIGVFTYIIGYIFNIPVLVMLSILNIAGCTGDLVMFYNLVKLKDIEYAEYDDPVSFGLYTSEDLTDKKMFGLKYVEKADKLKQEDFRRIQYSVLSIILLVSITVLNLIGYLLMK